MSSATRAIVRPMRTLFAARRTYATLPTKNPTPSGPIEPSRTQAHPIGAFYEAILNTPQLLPEVKPEEPATSVKENLEQEQAAAPESSESAPAKRGRKPKATKSSVSSNSSSSSSSGATFSPATTITEPSTQEKAKVIFGSSLAGPAERAERLAQIRIKSTVVAGVVVPPKPEEPDNCCMSGCVDCVWDRFRDEMETWAGANAEAQRRVAAAATGNAIDTSSRSNQKQQATFNQATASMDDDGGGSETNWNSTAESAPALTSGKISKDFWDDELYKDIPVGIREFMKQEKRLKEKHMQDSSVTGNGG